MNIASFTGVVMASRRPVNNAVAMARLSPSSVVRIRASIASRSPCMNAAYRNDRPPLTGGATVLMEPVTKPDAPIP
jgi:hypothetical protein